MTRLPWEKIFSVTPLDLTKFIISAAIIVLATKIQLVNDRLSALIIALPLSSLIAMIWMHQAGQSPERLANHAESTFWFVLPTLPLFLIFPWLLRHGWGFWSALGLNALITIGLFATTVWALRRFGIDLMPN